MKSICWTNGCPARNVLNIGARFCAESSPILPFGKTTCLETIMALSLPGERSVTAATPANPFAAVLRWIARAKAARSRRNALSALFELDASRLNDLGIHRDDIAVALTSPGLAQSLNAARARNAQR